LGGGGWGHRALFEAFATALAKVGNFDGKTFEELKQRILRRHKDGPNDHRAGHKETAVFALNVVIGGIVCRLVFIACLRLALDGIGKITQIPFHLLAVRAGLLRSDHAKEQALRGFTSESSTSGKKLIELGCKKECLGSLCRGLAHSRDEPEHCVENGVRKGGRKCTVFDFFVKFHGLFDAKFDGALGRVLSRIKRFGTKNWEEFEPPVSQKEE
jgi:hypothetical protein